MKNADCLIIDGFGLLSSIYRYGEIAYVGGGFGVGIHNILEAAVYGIPVIFGPKYQKFMEAKQLLEENGAFSIKNYEELPENCKKYIEYIENKLNCNVSMVSVGPERSQNIYRHTLVD